MVASYALGLISRHDDDATVGSSVTSTGTHQLVFLWAPFLLIHLGGQDTITAFALEDNNLWLRHLLNLVIQVSVASYVFWKSTSETDTQILIVSMLLFVTGIIKYGERTWALRSGVLKTLSDYHLPHYAEQLRETAWASQPLDEAGVSQLIQHIDRDDTSSEVGVLSVALYSIEAVLSFFWNNGWFKPELPFWAHETCPLLPKLLEILGIELGLVYDYIYTKAVVFQTRVGVILRCISQTCFVASFLLFVVLLSNKRRYNSVDCAVTYALFVGGFALELCAVLTTVMSPWTWAWLEARKCSFLASLFVRWQGKRVWWSHTMGQYDMHNYLGQYDQSSSWKQGVMAAIRKVVDACCGAEQRFWVSKLMDAKSVEVDKETMRCIFEKVVECAGSLTDGNNFPCLPQRWPNLGALLQKVLPSSDGSKTLNWLAITALHTYTETQLRLYSPSPSDVDGESTRDLVRKISRYVVYLLATQPGMLPVSKDAENKDPRRNRGPADLDDMDNIKMLGMSSYFSVAATKTAGNNTRGNKDDAFLSRASEILTNMGVPVPRSCTKDQLLETKEAWTRLVIYIAGRSRPELHAGQLARGGELLTLVWLFMAHRGIGDSVMTPIETTDDELARRGGLILFRFSAKETDGSSTPAPGAQVSEATTPLGEP
ncbi:hypothetical protein QOZ80_6BG0492440 [Eleusine coracana subsp. coracana]|nr:hypothetical protein QOZ80_6BG0492440 [Eleusine coracana subsp. coracana]